MDLKKELIDAVFSAGARAAVSGIAARLSKRPENRIDPAIVEQRLQYQASRILAVKTLLSTESPVSIHEFYCAPRVTVGEKSFVPESSKSFLKDHILVEGVAGQGKSILLRHLCATSVLTLGKIAFFYELRRLDPLKTLIRVLQESLTEIGIPGNNENLKSLAVSRDVELYLDGFDEVDQKTAEKIDRDIDYFARHHPFIKIFVSARPHAGLSKNAALVTHRIESLNKQDAFRLIKTLCKDEAQSKSLQEKLEHHDGDAIELLETPLLVTLLVAQYAYTQQIPEQLADFYDSIFILLFERHDSYKAPFVRKKRLSISVHTYRKVFQQFCFASLFTNALGNEVADSIAKWALGEQKVHAESQDFLADVSTVSSLINSEGGVWSFIHNSVQEYYAAAYLLSGTDHELVDRANRLSDIPNPSSREQVFRFAREIDEFRSIRFIDLPRLEQLSAPVAADEELTNNACMSWLRAHITAIEEDKNIVPDGSFFSIYVDTNPSVPIRLFAAATNQGSMKAALAESSVIGKLDALLQVGIFEARIVAEARKRLGPWLAQRLEYQRRISERDESGAASDRFLKALLKGA